MAITMTRWSATLIKSVAAVLCIYIFFTIVVTDRNAYRSTQDLIRASRHRLTEDTTYDHIKNETLGVRLAWTRLTSMANWNPATVREDICDRSERANRQT